MAADTASKRSAFRALHGAGCFVLPNPWDAGGARRLERMGFPALATTSAGVAWTLGKDDGQITLDEALAHLRTMCAATDLPINADFENGFADEPAGVAANVAHAVETGVAGISIEDRRRPSGDIYAAEHAVARIAAARAAIDSSGHDVMLVGRCEAFLAGRPDLDEVIARLRAFAAAGADCVYAPGVVAPDQVARIVQAVAPTPVNVLLLFRPRVTVAELAAVGVRRVSVGSTLAKLTWRTFDHVATTLAKEGRLPDPT